MSLLLKLQLLLLDFLAAAAAVDAGIAAAVDRDLSLNIFTTARELQNPYKYACIARVHEGFVIVFNCFYTFFLKIHFRFYSF